MEDSYWLRYRYHHYNNRSREAYLINVDNVRYYAFKQMWSTDLLVDPSMIGAMVNVRLPVTPQTNLTILHNLPQLLEEKYTTWVPVYPLNVSFV